MYWKIGTFFFSVFRLSYISIHVSGANKYLVADTCVTYIWLTFGLYWTSTIKFLLVTQRRDITACIDHVLLFAEPVCMTCTLHASSILLSVPFFLLVFSFISNIISFFVVVELPDEPDGKKFEVFFEREGQVEASTQTTRPVTVISYASDKTLPLVIKIVNPCFVA